MRIPGTAAAGIRFAKRPRRRTIGEAHVFKPGRSQKVFFMGSRSLADSSLTRRRFMLRSAQMGAGAAAGSLISPIPAPAFHGSEHRALAPPGPARPPLTNADYWRFA